MVFVKTAQLFPIDDESFEFLCGEGGERRCGRLENRFLTQLFGLVYPDLAVSRDFRETFGCVLGFKGRMVREPGANDNGNRFTITRQIEPTTSSLVIKLSEHSQRNVEEE